jgi:spore cortex formation protein SpoVR/YcgB (stage V sporulation)
MTSSGSEPSKPSNGLGPPVPLPGGSEWSFKSLHAYDEAIGRLASAFGLDGYPHQLEVINSQQMMDAYASVGMPVNYHHWSFGKHFLETEGHYRRGQMGLAYEIVINSDPCIAYLMEENTLTMQALVIAHAAYGHNSFFKGNHLFRQWTSADAILDYLVFARDYIAECEERHGQEAVERMLDACHALMNLGVDRYRRSPRLSLVKEQLRQQERESFLQSQVNELWRTLPASPASEKSVADERFPPEPEENLLYFIEKNAPLLEPWQREIVRIVRKVAQYFYPQRQTQLMNEGWATFWHFTLLNALYDEGQVGDGFMFEFLHSHTNVVHQLAYSSGGYNGINPYALGFAVWRDLRRICEAGTAEDRRWFPDLIGTDWRETLSFAMRNFKDESFIAQFLSPHLIRKFRLFMVVDDEKDPKIRIGAIHDEAGYADLRHTLAEQYNLGSREPDIQVWNVDRAGDRTLTLRYINPLGRPLAKDFDEVLEHLAYLWGFTVSLDEVDAHGDVKNLGFRSVEKRRR